MLSRNKMWETMAFSLPNTSKYQNVRQIFHGLLIVFLSWLRPSPHAPLHVGTASSDACCLTEKLPIDENLSRDSSHTMSHYWPTKKQSYGCMVCLVNMTFYGWSCYCCFQSKERESDVGISPGIAWSSGRAARNPTRHLSPLDIRRRRSAASLGKLWDEFTSPETYVNIQTG